MNPAYGVGSESLSHFTLGIIAGVLGQCCVVRTTKILPSPRAFARCLVRYLVSFSHGELSRSRFPWVGLFALSAVIFLNVTTEMVPTGLLPDMSSSLGVSEEQIGLLVTYFAFTVVLTSTFLTMGTRRIPRRALIIWTLLVATVSLAFTALSPTYELVIVSRVVGAVAHGLFWAVVVAYSGHLVAKEYIGRAVSISLAGATLAFVVGVPLATIMGHAFGWRSVFALLAVLMFGGAIIVWRLVPTVEQSSVPARSKNRDGTNTRARGPLRFAFRSGRGDSSVGAVALLCASVALIMIGYFAFFTYVAPFLIGSVGAGRSDVGPLLFVYGIAGAGGLFLAGTVLANRPHVGVILVTATLAAAFLALGLGASNGIVAITSFTVLGFAFGALPPLLQTRMLHTSSDRFRDVASSLFSTSFNAGIGTGALVGAVILGWGGIGALPFFSVAILALGCVLLIAVRRRAHRHAESE